MDGRRRGRPALGADLVDSITEASPLARERLEAILRTLSGEWTLEEACAQLRLGRSAFCELRRRFLRESAQLLEPRRPGPKAHVQTDADREVNALQRRIVDLELDVQAAEIREELAAVLRRPTERKKKTPKRRRR